MLLREGRHRTTLPSVTELAPTLVWCAAEQGSRTATLLTGCLSPMYHSQRATKPCVQQQHLAAHQPGPEQSPVDELRPGHGDPRRRFGPVFEINEFVSTGPQWGESVAVSLVSPSHPLSGGSPPPRT